MMSKRWSKFPGEDYTGEPITTLEWTGPGWYITTRQFPGSEIYKTWRVNQAVTDDTDLNRQDHRDQVARSFGACGFLQYLESQPAE